ncbi:MAG: phosphoribosylformylglycinamidine synthase subunit PurS [Candidatus Micrarchaeia archaeon]
MEQSTRIKVFFKQNAADSEGERVKKAVEDDLQIQLQSVKVASVYEVRGLEKNDFEEVASKLFTDPLTQEYVIGTRKGEECNWVVEVSLKKGVTDNVARTAVIGIKDVLKKDLPLSVRALKQYSFSGELSEDQVKTICNGLLANELIQNYKYWKC